MEVLKERTTKNKYEDSYISRILHENMKIEKAEKVMRYKIPTWTTDPMDDAKVIRYDQPMPPGRPYIFRIENFCTHEEMKNIGFIPAASPEPVQPEIPQPEQTDLPF
jgi:hypothetical protein